MFIPVWRDNRRGRFLVVGLAFGGLVLVVPGEKLDRQNRSAAGEKQPERAEQHVKTRAGWLFVLVVNPLPAPSSIGLARSALVFLLITQDDGSLFSSRRFAADGAFQSERRFALWAADFLPLLDRGSKFQSYIAAGTDNGGSGHEWSLDSGELKGAIVRETMNASLTIIAFTRAYVKSLTRSVETHLGT